MAKVLLVLLMARIIKGIALFVTDTITQLSFVIISMVTLISTRPVY